MSTHSVSSAVFNVPVENLWKLLRNFDFPARLVKGVVSCTLQDGQGPTSVGALRVTKYESGETRTHRLLRVDDIHYTTAFELVDSEPAAEVMASLTTIQLYRITETNATLVWWETEFSAGVEASLIRFEQNAKQELLKEIRAAVAALPASSS